jgi:hypothetical protein
VCCIKIFPYEDATEFAQRLAFAYVEQEEGDEYSFEDWDWEMIAASWFYVTDKGWGLAESLEEAIIEAFDLLGFEYDEADLDRLYGLEEYEGR